MRLPSRRAIEGIDEPYDTDWWLRGWMHRERLARLEAPDRRLAALFELRAMRAERRG